MLAGRGTLEYPLPVWLLVSLLGVVVATALANERPPVHPIQKEMAAIVTGCAGGVTGGGSGVKLYRDGRLVRWKRSGALEAPIEILVRTDGGLAKRLFERLEEIGFASIEYDEPSNWTCFVEANSHEVGWSSMDTAAPIDVVKLKAELDRIAGATRRSD